MAAGSKRLCAKKVERFSLSFNHYEIIRMGITTRFHSVEKTLVQTLSKGDSGHIFRVLMMYVCVCVM